MTFPINKRINTELFIDGKHELYIHMRQIKNTWSDLLEIGIDNFGLDATTRGNENQ